MLDEFMSAMLDGQASLDETRLVLSEMERSPALKVRWSRMVAARDALAGVEIRSLGIDFASNVMAAIEADEMAEGGNSKVIPLKRNVEVAPLPRDVSPRRARAWKPVAGLAAAASITATVVVLGGNAITSDADHSRTLAQSAATNTDTGSSGRPFDVAALDRTGRGSSGLKETRWSQIDAATARELNDYLMEHSNSRSESGMGGSLSYARLAVRTADSRQADERR